MIIVEMNAAAGYIRLLELFNRKSWTLKVVANFARLLT